jgi:hypothetical protein
VLPVIRAFAGQLAAVQHYTPRHTPHPLALAMHISESALTGHAWLKELLVGHPDQFCNQMGVSKHVFRPLLCEQGKSERHMTEIDMLEHDSSRYVYDAHPKQSDF